MNSPIRFLPTAVLWALVPALVHSAPPVDPSAHIKSLAALYSEPGLWDAALFFPLKSVGERVASFKGAGIDVPGLVTGAKKPLRLTVEQATLSGDWGSANAKLKMRLENPENGDMAQLSLSARLVSDGFGATDETSGVMRFHVALEAAGDAQIDGANFGHPQLAAELRKRAFTAAFGKQLAFALPVPLDFTQRVKFDEEVHLRASDQGWVKLKVKIPPSELPLKIGQVDPVFVPSGVWLCARMAGTEQPKPGKAPATTVEEALSLYEKQAAQIGRLLVNGRFIETSINALGALPPAQRTATITAPKHGGRLLHTGGDVHVQVWPENDNATGKLEVKPSAIWTDAGLRIGCSYNADVKADLHIHMDPGPTGGFGTSTGAKGETGGWLDAAVEIKPSSNEHAHALFLRPKFDEGQELVAELRTDGRAAFKVVGSMWKFSVPSVGVRITMPVPPDIVPAIAILSDKPIALLPAAAAPKPPAAAPYGVLTPLDFRQGPLGWQVDFTVGIEMLTPAEVTGRQDAVDDLTYSPAESNLAIGKVEILLGPWAIGPNNDLVKFVMAVVRAGENALREAQRAGKNVEREVSRAAENIADTLKDAEKDVGRELRTVRRNFGRTATKAWKASTAELKRFGRKIGGVAEDVVKPIGKVGRWLKNRF